VIGGGYVGLELSQAMRRFGSNVSVIDRNDRLLHREDEDVSEGLHSLFEDEGIDIVLNARIKSVSGKSGEAVKVLIEQKGVRRRWRAVICWLQQAALRTQRISDWSWLASN
jgi:pyruvate/2-oxoglutarate dehydrogenase complex dihydrolipoamide dehydrogenase (E3) component